MGSGKPHFRGVPDVSLLPARAPVDRKGKSRRDTNMQLGSIKGVLRRSVRSTDTPSILGVTCSRNHFQTLFRFSPVHGEAGDETNL